MKEESQDMREARSSRGEGGKINELKFLVGLEVMELGFWRELSRKDRRRCQEDGILDN